MQLEEYRVGDLDTIYYIPNYLTEAEEGKLLKEIYSAPVTKWKVMKNRRLQDWGGVVHEKGLISQSMPAWLTALTERVCRDTSLFPSPINHVLVNEYRPGQGIMAHQDGPLYFPVVAIVSTGAPTMMRFSPHLRHAASEPKSEPPSEPPSSDPSFRGSEGGSQEGARGLREGVRSIVLMPRSLLLFKDAAYAEYLHAIDDREEDVLDSTVMNVDATPLTLCSEGSCPASDFPLLQDQTNIGKAGVPKPSNEETVVSYREGMMLKRVGTRVSLTCRVVLKVKPKLLRL